MYLFMKKISKILIFSLLFVTIQVDASSKSAQKKATTPPSYQGLEHRLIQQALCNTTQTALSSPAETSAQSSSSSITEQPASVNELMIEAFSAEEIQQEIATSRKTSPSSPSPQSNKKRKTEDKKNLEDRLLSVQSTTQSLFVQNNQLHKLLNSKDTELIALQAQEASSFEANNKNLDEMNLLKKELEDKNAELIAAKAGEIAHANEAKMLLIEIDNMNAKSTKSHNSPNLHTINNLYSASDDKINELRNSLLRTEIALSKAEEAYQSKLAQDAIANKLPDTINGLKKIIFDTEITTTKATEKLAALREAIELNGSGIEYNSDSGSED